MLWWIALKAEGRKLYLTFTLFAFPAIFCIYIVPLESQDRDMAFKKFACIQTPLLKNL